MIKIAFRIYNFVRRIERKILAVRLRELGGNMPNVLGRIYINASDLKIGKNVTFYPGAYLWGRGIELGDNVDVGINTIVYSRSPWGGGKSWE